MKREREYKRERGEKEGNLQARGGGKEEGRDGREIKKGKE